MKWRIVLYVGFTALPWLRASTQAIEPGDLEKEILFLREKWDSIPAQIAAGQAIQGAQSCQLYDHYTYFSPSTSLSIPRYSLSLSGRKKDNYLYMQALVIKGTEAYEARDYKLSVLIWQKALEISVENGFDYEELHSLRPALNNNCFLSGNFSGAMRISSEGLIKASKINDQSQVAHFYNVIGNIHLKLKNFAEADRYFRNYLAVATRNRDTTKMAHALFDLSDLALAKGEYDSCVFYGEKSFATYRSIQPREFLLFSHAEREAYITNKIAEAAKLKGDLDLALSRVLHSIDIALTRAASNEYDKASYYINAGDIYNLQGKTDSARAYYRVGLSIAERIKHRENKRDAFRGLSQVYFKLKHYDSAYIYQEWSNQQKDSILDESSNLQVFQQEAALQIEQERIQQQRITDRQRLLKNIMAGLALFLLVIGYLLYNRYRLRQKATYQKELNRQQNELFNAIAEAQDQERKRIAQDIHDSLGAILSAARLRLSALKEEPSQPETGKLTVQTTLQLLDEASTELRNISHNIMPATLSKLGLVAALKNLSDNISSHSGLQVTFAAHGFEERIEEKTEMSLYRIVLELLNNSVKHAQATKVTIQVVRHPDYINLTVEDNGIGFDLEQAKGAKKGIGLGNIDSRVKYLEGSFHVDSLPGRGTTVLIDIPYKS